MATVDRWGRVVGDLRGGPTPPPAPSLDPSRFAQGAGDAAKALRGADDAAAAARRSARAFGAAGTAATAARDAARAAAPAAAAPTRLGAVWNGTRVAASGAGSALPGVGGYVAGRAMQGIELPDGPARPNPPNLQTLVDQIPSGPAGSGADFPAPAAQPYNFFQDTDVGRNIRNTANAVAPLRGVGAVASAAGALPAVGRAATLGGSLAGGLAEGARTPEVESPAPAQTSRTAPADIRNYPTPAATGPDQTSGLLDGVGQYATRADGTPSLDNVIRFDPNTNTYSGRNVGADAQWAGRRNGGGTVSSLGDLGLGAAQRTAAIYQSMLPREGDGIGAPSVAHSGNDWQSRNDLRNLRVSAESIANQPRWRSARGNTDTTPTPAQGAYARALETDAAMRRGQMDLDRTAMDANARTRAANTAAAASMYGADRRSEDAQYSADQTLRGSIYNADSREATSRQTALTAEYKSMRDQAEKDRKFDADRYDKGVEQLSKSITIQATGEDGKVDGPLQAALHNGVQAYLGSAIAAARERGDEETAKSIEREGPGALVRDPRLMQQYTASIRAGMAAQNAAPLTGRVVGTDNPGARTITGITPRTLGLGGRVLFSDGTEAPRNAIEYLNGGVFSDWNPFAERTTEFDSIDPQRILQRTR